MTTFRRNRVEASSRPPAVVAVGWMLFCCCLTTTLHKAHGIKNQPFGLQAGNSLSSSFATSMVYNEQNREIAITGVTKGNYFQPTLEDDDEEGDANTTRSDCFVAVLRLPHVDATGQMTDPNQLSWVRRRQYGTSTAHEFCSDLLWDDKDGSMVAVGHTAGREGLLTSLLPHGNDRRQVYGTVLNLNSAMELQGGMLLHSNEIQFPVALAQDQDGSNNMYVVDLFSEYTGAMGAADLDNDQDFFSPDSLTEDGAWNDAGFAVRIQKIHKQQSSQADDESAFASEWMREYGTMQQESVMVSGLAMVKDRLVMTGYTAGSSSAFGKSKHNGDRSGSEPLIGSFLTVFDPETGDVDKVLRLDTEDPTNHRVMHMCHQEPTEEDDMPNFVFVVGTTELPGQGVHYAFVQQINIATMEVGWEHEIRGTLFPPSSHPDGGAKVHGVSCTVTKDGKDVYVAGNIMDGTVLMGEDDGNRRRRQLRQSNHNTNIAGDIFMAKLDASDGTMAFSREVGSDGNDSVAPGNSLTTDAEGNLIVMANTLGALYHEKQSVKGASEIIIFSVGRAKGDFYLPHTRSKDHDPVPTSQQVNPRQEKWLYATYALLSLLMVVVFVVGSLYWNRNRQSRKRYQSGLYEYEGIWRTAAFEPGTAGDEKLILTGRARDFDMRREQRYSDIDRARRISSASTTKFPLGSFSKSAGSSTSESTGDVYDLLAMASKRYSKVLADDQARARERLALAVRSATKYEEDGIPDISK